MPVVETHPKVSSYLQKIASHVTQGDPKWIKYVQLGSAVVKIICYSGNFLPLVEKQLSYSLKDTSDRFDAVIVLFHEKDIESFVGSLIDMNTKYRMRVEKLVHKVQELKYFETFDTTRPDNKLIIRINADKGLTTHFAMMDDAYSQHNPLIRICGVSGIINAYDKENNIYYYGVKDLNPEEFIKQGHIFVQMFNKIIKTPHSALVHGAAVGINNKGILFCARGQRGKSTLSVLAMMEGFDYVSDDYLVLEKEGDALFSYPIYSIITLSPRMYNELYDDLKGKFVSNNARRDKYVINIDAYHERFRDKYPIKICMFPQIVDDAKPSIVRCKKGQSITQLAHSTISQMEDRHDIKTIKKLISFVEDFEFYQINLCADIKANVACLKEFAANLN